jgi:hypothetical protein
VKGAEQPRGKPSAVISPNVKHVTSACRVRRYPMARRDHSRHRGWTDVNAAENILVVQVRGLGAISREISELAALQALVTFGWISAAKSAPKAKACIGWIACEMTFGVFQQVLP